MHFCITIKFFSFSLINNPFRMNSECQDLEKGRRELGELSGLS